MRPILATFLTVTLVCPLAADEPPARRPTDPTSAVVLRAPEMEKVRVRADLFYETVGETRLAADLYLPPDSTKRPGVAILVAGGAENTKDWASYRSLGRLLAASGIAAVPFDHRLRYPRRQYEEGAADLLALIAFLRREAAGLGIDADRIAVATFSGGGPMLSVPMRERVPQVRCLLAFYSFLDTEHVDPGEAGTTAEVVRKFSPLGQFRKDPASLPPLFVARAGRDEVPGVNASIDRFAAAALQANAPLILVNHPTGAHGFDFKNDDARSREILSMAIAFLRAHLG
jgi:acetyl esterase/lipase